jgi:hypothetical protein
MRKIINLFACCIAVAQVYAQVSVNNDGSPPHSSAMFEVKSDNKGFLPPRMGWPKIQSIANPAAGLVVYDEGIKALRMYDGSQWIVLGVKEVELTDPVGNFSDFTSHTSTGNAASSQALALGSNKKVAAVLSFLDTLFIGNDSFGTFNTQTTIIATFDSSGNYLLSKSFGNVSIAVTDILIDANGDFFTCGYFQNTVDFDFGPAVQNLTSTSVSGFFARYDAAWNLIWAKDLPAASGGIFPEKILTDGTGNCILSGTFNGTFDSDPGAVTQNLMTAGGADIFFAKYDAGGNWVWAKKIGGTDEEYYSDMIFHNGTIVLAGAFAGTVDFDPSGTIVNLVSAGQHDIFYSRYNGSGAFLWAKRLGGASNEASVMIAPAPDGNIYLGAIFFGTLDIDPDAATTNLASAGGSVDFFVARYTSTGALDPTRYFKVGGNNMEILSDLQSDNEGNIFVGCMFTGSVDFDPGSGVATLSSSGAEDGVILKYSPSMAFEFGKTFGGTLADAPNEIAVHREGKLLYIAGHNNSSPWKTLQGGKSVLNGYFLSRYEE